MLIHHCPLMYLLSSLFSTESVHFLFFLISEEDNYLIFTSSFLLALLWGDLSSNPEVAFPRKSDWMPSLEGFVTCCAWNMVFLKVLEKLWDLTKRA